MKDILIKLMKENDKDLLDQNIIYKHLLDTNIYKYLCVMSKNDILEVASLMLAGREKYYGNDLSFNDLLKDCMNEPILYTSNSDTVIDYIASKRDVLNTYLNEALKYMG